MAAETTKHLIFIFFSDVSMGFLTQKDTLFCVKSHAVVTGCVFHDIRPVIPREGGHAFHVIPAACSSDSGQAVGAKRRDWLLGTSFLGATSSWLSFSASILL